MCHRFYVCKAQQSHERNNYSSQQTEMQSILWWHCLTCLALHGQIQSNDVAPQPLHPASPKDWEVLEDCVPLATRQWTKVRVWGSPPHSTPKLQWSRSQQRSTEPLCVVGKCDAKCSQTRSAAHSLTFLAMLQAKQSESSPSNPSKYNAFTYICLRLLALAWPSLIHVACWSLHELAELGTPNICLFNLTSSWCHVIFINEGS